MPTLGLDLDPPLLLTDRSAAASANDVVLDEVLSDYLRDEAPDAANEFGDEREDEVADEVSEEELLEVSEPQGSLRPLAIDNPFTSEGDSWLSWLFAGGAVAAALFFAFAWNSQPQASAHAAAQRPAVAAATPVAAAVPAALAPAPSPVDPAPAPVALAPAAAVAPPAAAAPAPAPAKVHKPRTRAGDIDALIESRR